MHDYLIWQSHHLIMLIMLISWIWRRKKYNHSIWNLRKIWATITLLCMYFHIHYNHLTLPMLRLPSFNAQDAKIFDNYLNPVMLVFIGKLSFLHYFVLAKLATSSIRVRCPKLPRNHSTNFISLTRLRALVNQLTPPWVRVRLVMRWPLLSHCCITGTTGASTWTTSPSLTRLSTVPRDRTLSRTLTVSMTLNMIWYDMIWPVSHFHNADKEFIISSTTLILRKLYPKFFCVTLTGSMTLNADITRVTLSQLG